uniref:Large ribosomal subunit protein uL2c n=1 Tax=Vaginularia trichoidea TaxID=474354 RepID=A0A3G5CTC4_9MONI|nr:ribosomal protein L2 [Vaginularia trichoidea]AYW16115.1 ribosomal protein L2 [Vaginularia trichoidea]
MDSQLNKIYISLAQNRKVSGFSTTTGNKPYKKLTHGKLLKSGRNNRGIITSRHKGGAHKRLYRKIDLQRNKVNIIGRVASIEYDPNRNAHICLINYIDGDKKYILHPRGLNNGDIISAGPNAPISTGNALPLTKIPLGTIIHNIELQSGKGGQLVRAAGTIAKIIAKEGQVATVRLPSSEIRLIPINCLASIGRVGNADRNNKTLKKAGRMRWLGKRPRVRGSAMNPVDHPHGGGEGRTPIGRKKPLTPWGHVTLGRGNQKKKCINPLILRRRKQN